MKLPWCAALAAASLSAQTFAGAPALDEAINQAIAQDRLPGAVLVVGHNGQIVYRKAYGKRALVPRPETMTLDTIFDCASLTKVIATTPSLMKLFEHGKFRLNDKVTDYIPEFQGGKSDITLRDLFTHFSGLQPDVPLKPEWTGYDTGIRLACITKPAGPPGVRFVYSDINFILLGEIVHRLSGQMLSDYARRNIFLPLGMRDTMFLPPASLVPRIAPTERVDKTSPPLRGVVHDPSARAMGGVAGHAGVFSTAADLARFCQMMLNGGSLDGVRLFSPLTVAKFTEPQSPPGQPILRGLGWDIDSPYSGNRGELFPIGSYGHTGFTGTSIWIDPSTQSYVILLANSVHPDGGRPALTPLRSKVATIVAAALGAGHNGATLTGLDVLAAQDFQPLQGKHVGLITNQTGVDRLGRRNVDLIRAAGVPVAALFSPEHGFDGREDRPGLPDVTDAASGIKIFSLYGKTLRPTPEMLRGIDALVFDIQDVGARFYTYETTMAYAMEAAAKAGIPYYVLDRPNPITGDARGRPAAGRRQPVVRGLFSRPAGAPRHDHGRAGAPLQRGEQDWRGAHRDSRWRAGIAATGSTIRASPWINPSPNLRSLNAATLYPGLCLLEASKGYSVGRGTDSPFEQIGADFIAGRELAAYLNRRGIPGVRVYPTRVGAVEGVRFVIVNRDLLDATRLGLEVAAAIAKLYPGKIDFSLDKLLIGSAEAIRQLQAGDDPRSIQQGFQDAVAAFVGMRQPYLLYR